MDQNVEQQRSVVARTLAARGLSFLSRDVSQHSAGLDANNEEEDATEGKTSTLQMSLLRLETPPTRVAVSFLNH